MLSGNPSDHLVHRHTHRVVRGSLLVCGRPDGRLPALTSLEASCCLAVNQTSSIQSLGGTCESITIGHNESKLPLSHKAIYLKSHRHCSSLKKCLLFWTGKGARLGNRVKTRLERIDEEAQRSCFFARNLHKHYQEIVWKAVHHLAYDDQVQVF